MAAAKKTFDKNFNMVLIGQIISLFGASILRFALSTYVLDTTGRADIFALLVAVSAVPGILLSPIGGVLADRVSRRDLMVVFDFSSAFIVLCLALFMGSREIGVVSIGVVMTLLSTISALYQPAVQASIPVLVKKDDIPKANGLINGVSSLSGLMGPILGGVLYGIVGIRALVALGCAAFFASAVMEIFIKIPFVKRPSESGFVKTMRADLGEGLRYVTKDNKLILKTMVIAAALNMFLTPFFVVSAPFMLRVTMHSGDFIYGVGMGLLQLSTIVGALLIGRLSHRMKVNRMYVWFIAAALLTLPVAGSVFPAVLSAPALSFGLFFAGSLPIGAILTLVSVYIMAMIQEQTPNHLLGKVMALLMAAAQCAAPLGQVLYGWLHEVFKDAAFVPVLIMGAFTLVIAMLGGVALKNEGSGQKAAETQQLELPA